MIAQAGIINDPYPTPYPSCGFDLDAVGVIHKAAAGIKTQKDNVSLSVYPNPATDKIMISVSGEIPGGLTATLTTIAGNILQTLTLSQAVSSISIQQYPAGMYYLVIGVRC